MALTNDSKFLTRKYVLMFIDMMLLCLSLLIYLKYFYESDVWPRKTLSQNAVWYVVLCVLWAIYSNLFRLYNALYASTLFSFVQRTFFVAFITSLSYLLIPFLSPLFPTSRLPFFIFISQSVAILTIWHLIFGKFLNKPAISKRVLILGAGWSGKRIAQIILDKDYSNKGYDIVGFIDDDNTKVGGELEGIRVISSSDDMFIYARRLKIDLIVLAAHTAESINGKLYSHLTNCQNYGIEVRPVNLLYEELTGKLMVKESNEKLALTYEYYSKPEDLVYRIVNRLLNVFFGIFGLIICGISIPFVWYLNALFSRGPLFYSQIRTGRNNQDFRIYKFRTMVIDAEKGTGAVWAGKNDARITGPGKFYRKTRIDELPQFWNVLKGDMNLIGPRPERPKFVEELSVKIPFFNLRHIVKPGITGWAQVRHKYGNTEEDSLIKLQFDLYYIKYRSFFLDMSIIWRTVAVMLKFKGN
ncbi:sugar transferase [Salibacteraceae bacterium]|nr:sugar transferase [Salibacteraceae bacterium]